MYTLSIHVGASRDMPARVDVYERLTALDVLVIAGSWADDRRLEHVAITNADGAQLYVRRGELVCADCGGTGYPSTNGPYDAPEVCGCVPDDADRADFDAAQADDFPDDVRF